MSVNNMARLQADVKSHTDEKMTQCKQEIARLRSLLNEKEARIEALSKLVQARQEKFVATWKAQRIMRFAAVNDIASDEVDAETAERLTMLDESSFSLMLQALAKKRSTESLFLQD